MPMTEDLSYSMDISGVANTAIILVTFVLLGCVFLFRWREAAALRKATVSPAPAR
jgi:hypothetical protein